MLQRRNAVLSWFFTLGGVLDNRQAVQNVERVLDQRRRDDAALDDLVERLAA